jgi:O-antigen ligase
MPMYLRGGLGPMRFSHRLGKRNPWQAVRGVVLLGAIVFMTVVCISTGMPWFIVPVAATIVWFRNEMAKLPNKPRR